MPWNGLVGQHMQGRVCLQSWPLLGPFGRLLADFLRYSYYNRTITVLSYENRTSVRKPYFPVLQPDYNPPYQPRTTARNRPVPTPYDQSPVFTELPPLSTTSSAPTPQSELGARSTLDTPHAGHVTNRQSCCYCRLPCLLPRNIPCIRLIEMHVGAQMTLQG